MFWFVIKIVPVQNAEFWNSEKDLFSDSKVFEKMGQPRSFCFFPGSFCLFLVFSNKHWYNFYNKSMWKMSIQYMALGFEPTTFLTWVVTHNHLTRAPAVFLFIFIFFKQHFTEINCMLQQDSNSNHHSIRLCWDSNSQSLSRDLFP